jgi:hypothetical protein
LTPVIFSLSSRPPPFFVEREKGEGEGRRAVPLFKRQTMARLAALLLACGTWFSSTLSRLISISPKPYDVPSAPGNRETSERMRWMGEERKKNGLSPSARELSFTSNYLSCAMIV